MQPACAGEGPPAQAEAHEHERQTCGQGGDLVHATVVWRLGRGERCELVTRHGHSWRVSGLRPVARELEDHGYVSVDGREATYTTCAKNGSDRRHDMRISFCW